MPKLKCTVEEEHIIKTIIHVEIQHLREFIKEVYGKVPDIRGDLHWYGNEIELDLQMTGPLEIDSLEKLTYWKDGNYVTGMTHILLKDMLNKNLITPGTYLIWTAPLTSLAMLIASKKNI